jgi:hypothetical protein
VLLGSAAAPAGRPPGARRAQAAGRRPARSRPSAPSSRWPQAVPASSDRVGAVVAASLDDLRGPVSGTVELPLHLYWSGLHGRFSLDDPGRPAAGVHDRRA